MKKGKPSSSARPPPVTEREVSRFMEVKGHRIRVNEDGIPVAIDDDEVLNTETDRTAPFSGLSLRKGEHGRFTVMTGMSAGMVIAFEKQVTIIGRGRDADVTLDDTGVSRRHSSVTVHENGQYVLQDLNSTNGTIVNGRPIRIHPLRVGDRVQLGPNVVLQFALFDEAEETLARRLFEASTRDALTGAYNRRFFFNRLDSELAYAVRHRTQLGVILFDLDHFKAINDQFGHGAGDATLRAVAQLVTTMSRAEDVFARWGGEEFALIVRGVDPAGVQRFAERLREGTENLAIEFEGAKVKVTLSAGVANYRAGAPMKSADLMRLADERLYDAKQGGRNRVCDG